MSTGTQERSTPISYGQAPVRVPLRERINVRMIVFIGVVLLLIGAPVYIYVDSVLSGGVKNAGDRLVVDLKALSNFPFDQENGTLNDVPKQWRELDGKRVELTGEMWSSKSAAPELARFELVYSIAKCCMSGPPQIQHFVQASTKDGSLVPMYNGLVRIVGTLHVDVKKEAGRVSQVYALDVETVEPI